MNFRVKHDVCSSDLYFVTGSVIFPAGILDLINSSFVFFVAGVFLPPRKTSQGYVQHACSSKIYFRWSQFTLKRIFFRILTFSFK